MEFVLTRVLIGTSLGTSRHRRLAPPRTVIACQRSSRISLSWATDPKTHTNEQTANAALKRMGLKGKLVAHGLRALGSTTLNEKGFDPDVIEAALAHSDKDEVRSAYNRTDYLDRRREMMEWWSKHIEQAAGVGSALTWKPSVIAS